MRLFVALGLAFFLTACGGGGGGGSGETSGSTPAPVATAEGIWSAGTSPNGGLVILENGETWGIFFDSLSHLSGAFYSPNTTSGGTTLSGTGGRFFALDGSPPVVANFTGSFSAQTTLSIPDLSPGFSFSGVRDPDYDTPASLATLAESYPGQVTLGDVQDTSQTTIDSNGDFTMSIPGLDCTAIGVATPRPGGKSIFDVTVSFSGSQCPIEVMGGTTGIGILTLPEKELAILTLTQDKTTGLLFTGSPI